MSRRIDKLLPEVQVDLNSAIVEMKEKGINFFIDSTLRTLDEQKALYAQGRASLDEVQRLRKIAGLSPLNPKDNTYVVTKVDGVHTTSMHQTGKAVDIVPTDKRGNPFWPEDDSPLWKEIANVMTKYNFEAGLYWKIFQDCPHYQWGYIK